MIGLALALAMQAVPHELVVRFFENTGPAYTRRYTTRAACERAREAIIADSQDRQRRNPSTNLPEPFTACVPI